VGNNERDTGSPMHTQAPYHVNVSLPPLLSPSFAVLRWMTWLRPWKLSRASWTQSEAQGQLPRRCLRGPITSPGRPLLQWCSRRSE
jgi:hypothetical protein